MEQPPLGSEADQRVIDQGRRGRSRLDQFPLRGGLHATLRKRLAAQATGLTPQAVLETLSAILMLDVHLPLADGRELVLPR